MQIVQAGFAAGAQKAGLGTMLEVNGCDPLGYDMTVLNNLLAQGVVVILMPVLGSYNAGTGVFTIEPVDTKPTYGYGTVVSINAPAVGATVTSRPGGYAPNVSAAKTYDVLVIAAPSGIAMDTVSQDFGLGTRIYGISSTCINNHIANAYQTRVFTAQLKVNPTLVKIAIQALQMYKQ
jgi:hypothetical protein